MTERLCFEVEHHVKQARRVSIGVMKNAIQRREPLQPAEHVVDWVLLRKVGKGAPPTPVYAKDGGVELPEQQAPDRKASVHTLREFDDLRPLPYETALKGRDAERASLHSPKN